MQALNNFLKGLDKRQLQQQIDVHRLYLLTGFHVQHREGELIADNLLHNTSLQLHGDPAWSSNTTSVLYIVQ